MAMNYPTSWAESCGTAGTGSGSSAWGGFVEQGLVGTKLVDESAIGDGRFIYYDAASGTMKYTILSGVVSSGTVDSTGVVADGDRPAASSLSVGDTFYDTSTGMLYTIIDTGGGVLGWDDGVLLSAVQGISPWMFINTRNCVIQPYDGNTLSRSGMDISLNADLKVNFAYGADETGFVNQVYDFGQFDVSAITIPAVDDIYHIYIDETGTLGYKTGASFVSIDDDQDIDAFTGVADMYHIVEGMMYDRTSTTSTPVPVHRVYLGHAIVSGGTISTTSGHFVSKPRNITRAGILTASDYIKTKRAFAQEYNRGTETYIKFHEYTNMKFDVSGDVTFTMSAPELLLSGQTGIIEFVNTGTVTSLTFPSTFYFPYEDSTKAARITPDLPLASGDRYMIAYYIGANKSVYVTDYQTFE